MPTFPNSRFELKVGDVVAFYFAWGETLAAGETINTSLFTTNLSALTLQSQAVITCPVIFDGKQYAAYTAAKLVVSVNGADPADIVEIRHQITTTQGQTFTAADFLKVVRLYESDAA